MILYQKKCLKNIIEKFKEKDNSIFSLNKDYLYSSLLMLFISLAFFFGLIFLALIFNLFFGSIKSELLDLIVSIVVIMISSFGTIKFIKWLSNKLYDLFYKNSNQKVFDLLVDEVTLSFNDNKNKIYVAEYIYYFHKFEGGMENKKNVLLLTYLIDKYGFEEKTIDEIVLDDRTRLPILKACC